jgi:uncharacterized RDD family membrane protein YckC
MPYCTSCGTQAAEGQQFCTTCGKEVAAPVVTHTPMPYFPTEGIAPSDGYAGFWWRVLAYLIDVIILGIIVAIIGSAASMGNVARVILAVAFAFIYGTFFITTRSQTIGMMITRLRVESVDGTKVTFNQAAIRTGFYAALLLLSDLYHRKSYVHPTVAQQRKELHNLGILLLFALPEILDSAWMLWDKRKQTVHDKVAKTVVKRRS